MLSMVTSEQFHRVSAASGMLTLRMVRFLQRRKPLGASYTESSMVKFSLYQIPARAISKKAEFLTWTFLVYQKGYFHWKREVSTWIFCASFRGDSPSPNTVSEMERSLAAKSMRSPENFLPVMLPAVLYSLAGFKLGLSVCIDTMPPSRAI